MKLGLAPLADFTDAPFRLMCFRGGADFAFTEMVSAAALLHGHGPTRHLMETLPGEGRVVCQFFGSAEQELAFAAREAEKVRERFVGINLNAGCPMQRIMQAGAGAKLIEDPAKVHRLLKAMVENTSLPVSLKTRLGPHRSEPRIMELLDAAESAGAKAIAVHARSTGQKHGGPLNLELLAETVRRARIPVYGNGSVCTGADLDAMAATGVEGVLIGRAALGNPAIFAQLKGEDASGRWGVTGPAAEHLKLILEFRDMLARKYPEDHVPSPDGIASIKMHTHLFRYFKGRPGAAALRARLNAIRTLDEVRAVIEGRFESAAAEGGS